MIHVSQPDTAAPEMFRTPLQAQVYRTLDALGIPFSRVDTDEAITMADCAAIDEGLSVKVVKTLFLCNRQKTAFYLYIMPGDKPFRSKDFSAGLGISRVSFAPPELLDTMMGVTVGAATVFSLLRPEARDVQLVMDPDVLAEPFYGCSDGTTTGYMKLRTADVTERLVPATGHSVQLCRM